MDVLFFNAGIHTRLASPIAAAGNGELRLTEKSSVSAQPKNMPWGFTFRHPLRSLWPIGKTRFDPAVSVDDAVLVEERNGVKEREEEGGIKNWMFKILHVRSLWKEEGKDGDLRVDLEEDCENDGEENGECDSCAVDYDDDEEKIEFDRESFSKLLRKVPLNESRLYSKMCYLGSLAYSIPQIKPGNLLRNNGLRFVTSSLDKKEALNIEKEKLSAQKGQKEATTEAEKTVKVDGNRISASATYQIVASAASYLHSHTRSILRIKPSNEKSPEQGGKKRIDTVNQDAAASLMVTDSVTAVVAAKEEVKQAVADDLNSLISSPCEWFACDDDQNATRFFVIQGSETLASWQANLLFEPIQFEGLDVLVHRGIYEAAKGIYEQMLPEIREHLKFHGNRATFRFTGHSLGGSLSLLVNLMLLIRGEAPRSTLLPVVTFGSPSILCGGDRLLRNLGLPRNHVQSIAMHRDIVPRAFSCNYPSHVAEFLKAVNGNFRHLPCLDKQKLLYTPTGNFLILQPDENFSPRHDLLPSGSGLYLLTAPEASDSEKQIKAALALFLNSPHPLEMLSDRCAYGSGGNIQRDHDLNSYLRTIRNVVRLEVRRVRKGRQDVWWPSGGVMVNGIGEGQFKFMERGKESLKRFSRLVASQHMHLLVVVLFPVRLFVLGTFNFCHFYT